VDIGPLKGPTNQILVATQGSWSIQIICLYNSCIEPVVFARWQHHYWWKYVLSQH